MFWGLTVYTQMLKTQFFETGFLDFLKIILPLTDTQLCIHYLTFSDFGFLIDGFRFKKVLPCLEIIITLTRPHYNHIAPCDNYKGLTSRITIGG